MTGNHSEFNVILQHFVNGSSEQGLDHRSDGGYNFMRNGGGGYGRNGSHYQHTGNGYSNNNNNGASTSSGGPGLMGDMPSGSGLSGSTLSLNNGPGPNGLNSDSPSRKRRRISGRPSQSPPAIWEPRRSQRVMVSWRQQRKLNVINFNLNFKTTYVLDAAGKSTVASATSARCSHIHTAAASAICSSATPLAAAAATSSAAP